LLIYTLLSYLAVVAAEVAVEPDAMLPPAAASLASPAERAETETEEATVIERGPRAAEEEEVRRMSGVRPEAQEVLEVEATPPHPLEEALAQELVLDPAALLKKAPGDASKLSKLLLESRVLLNVKPFPYWLHSRQLFLVFGWRS
jgi:hypothetical protein